MDEVGGDGFLITSPMMRLNRRYITEITDGLVPELPTPRSHPHHVHVRAVPRQPSGVLSHG